jgi:hypothetical protein
MNSRLLPGRARLPRAAERATIVAQIAVVRSLVDELERSLAWGGADDARREQLVAELARLGCRTLRVAAGMLEHGAGEGKGMSALLALLQ